MEFRSKKISKSDARALIDHPFDVVMILPKENPPKMNTYFRLERKDLNRFLKSMAKKGAYFVEIRPW